MMRSAPPVRRRLVGRALRRYRENLGYTLEDAAVMLECDRSKMSRVETGERGIRGKELRELLTGYGVDQEQQEILAVLADPRGATGWPHDYADVLSGAWRDYLMLETSAAKISAYEAQQIPGLLQIRDYARALAEADPALGNEAARERAADAVIARQQAIVNGPGRPDIHLIIGEAALHQEVGRPAIRLKQLRRLARIAGGDGSSTLRVLPFGSGAHAAVGNGSLAILSVARSPGLGVVHLGGIDGGVCLEGPRELNVYAEAFDRLQTFALSPGKSAALLRKLAELEPGRRR
jgi:transcriptional regulator with XRE-family HTH domain